MLVKNVIDQLEELAPLHYAESFDNVGLLTGSATNKLTGILVSLDTLEAVVDEAIAHNCNLIVSFHPIIFKGLTHLNAKNYVEKAIIKAIKNDIAIYAIHTALDNANNGVAESMAQQLRLEHTRILIPKSGTIGKLDVHVPTKNASNLLEQLFEAGAGSIGNYDKCSFSLTGEGTFMGNAESKPKLGKRGQLMRCEEQKIQVTFPIHLKSKLLKAMFAHHPYEEVAYEI
ncbi:MAG: Nif3-like dinuclear metal center hexameric protein, partial [Flavobacteriaceae bacterium]|nr:Nif3-like dinuclear metal center hexameric protein [Flavobacteriaceae bacterium]